MTELEALKKDIDILFIKINEIAIRLEELDVPPKTPTSKTAEIALLNYRLSRANAELESKRVQISNQSEEISRLRSKLAEIDEIIDR